MKNKIICLADICKAAEQGDAEAQFNLGLIYNNSEGVPRDDVEALKWFLEAAEQGHAEAQFNLGRMYYNGAGVQQDFEEATNWYRKAAEQGDIEAQDTVKIKIIT
jgi:TPR repeat protein